MGFMLRFSLPSSLHWTIKPSVLIVGSVSRAVSLRLGGWNRINWFTIRLSVWDVDYAYLVALQRLSAWWNVIKYES